ncbi:MAG TPA: hypothetical protein VKV03_09080 [Candidatus Binataceae bacterium]|nr:hypothetical protein [Candidatus Binataceae bacterium]
MNLRDALHAAFAELPFCWFEVVGLLWAAVMIFGAYRRWPFFVDPHSFWWSRFREHPWKNVVYPDNEKETARLLYAFAISLIIGISSDLIIRSCK